MTEIWFGVVDSHNSVVFESKNEKESRLVSNSYEGSIVKSYSRKRVSQLTQSIYTVIPYFSDGTDVNQNDVKSFFNRTEAEEYTYTLPYRFDLIENELI